MERLKEAFLNADEKSRILLLIGVVAIMCIICYLIGYFVI